MSNPPDTWALPWRRSKLKTAAELVNATCSAARACGDAAGHSGGGTSGGSSSSPATAVQPAELALAEVAQNMAQMKSILYGEPEAPPNREAALELAREVLKTDLLTLLIIHLPLFEFECRKDVSQVFSNLLRKHSEGEMITVTWVANHAELLEALLRGYETPKVALNYGIMLRESIRHERLAALLLPSAPDSPFYKLFEYVESPFFDVASDAFASLKDLLTRHKQRVARFLDEQYVEFFAHYHALLRSENYVTRRQSLKLLGEVLLDRSNFAIMTRYISSAEHLKTVMILLRDRSSSIQYEAFHVFKIFVANPNKEPRVRDVLLRNKEKLLEFMAEFQNDKADEQFADEKRFLIGEITRLEAPRPAAASADSLGTAARPSSDV
mmetsp:Transcript_34100/g.71811  ORF Transcript_34100/g.71811 Transcript_34100/m.71811 type:complete len:383 (+) Transcript_34100:225-1373(+)